MAVPTQGNGGDTFERAKSCFLKSLEIALGALQQDDFGELRGPTAEATSPKLSNKVFVVHGHDQGLKTDVERFLHEIGLEPIVLHRQPDQGQTIIEKFEKHSDVGYAFILLTPDEVAYTVDQEAKPDDARAKEKRARPNVIFEFGYFVGTLGRKRVCCLHKGGVVLPSDLDGLVYKRIDGSVDAQAFQIVRELRAAGYTIRM
jgi:predicted nucleotide-binding protein